MSSRQHFVWMIAVEGSRSWRLETSEGSDLRPFVHCSHILAPDSCAPSWISLLNLCRRRRCCPPLPPWWGGRSPPFSGKAGFDGKQERAQTNTTQKNKKRTETKEQSALFVLCWRIVLLTRRWSLRGHQNGQHWHLCVSSCCAMTDTVQPALRGMPFAGGAVLVQFEPRDDEGDVHESTSFLGSGAVGSLAVPQKILSQ